MPFFVGLDGEMTGGDYLKNELCQIGLATADGAVFVSAIRCDLTEYQADAMAVHGIDPGYLKEGAPHRKVVDARAVAWLKQQTNLRSPVPVGWGVSYFDMPYVRVTLPGLYAMLSRRSVELGAVEYSIASTFGLSQSTLKKRAKRYAEQKIQAERGGPQWHDAGYDALAAIYGWEYMRKVMKAGEYVE